MRLYDPVLDGKRSAVRYDRSYVDQIVARLLPLLKKIIPGRSPRLLAPSYSELNHPRPIFDWMQIVRQWALIYVGLDSLSDIEAASAIGNAMFCSLASVAGHTYKLGRDDGPSPSAEPAVKVPINLHVDEFIPLFNEGGGVGIQVTVYTQTMSDVDVCIGNRGKAGQVVCNVNNLFMLRMRETATTDY